MVIDSSGNRLGRPVITNSPSVSAASLQSSRIPEKNRSVDGFGSILQKKLDENGEIRFSKHAELRLQSRNITLTGSQKEKMREAVAKAEARGVRDSLVLMDNLAFVVNVPNRTVITAAGTGDLKENVFTNIDGAVIV